MNIYFVATAFLLLITLPAAAQQIRMPDSLKAGITVVDSSLLPKENFDNVYPGGATAWSKYLLKNLNMNVPYQNKAPHGIYNVIVGFFIKKDGSVANLVAVTHHGYGLEAEVMRIIKETKWLPLIRGGQALNSYRSQSVTFVVEER